MKNKKSSKKAAWFALSTLATSILFIQSAYALQALDDGALRHVNAQDGGLHIQTNYGTGDLATGTATGIDVDEFYWQDKTGGDKTLRASAQNMKIRSYGGGQLGTDYKINMGNDGTSTGLDFHIKTNHSLITVDRFVICEEGVDCTNYKSMGQLGIHSTTPIELGFQTSDGLFSKTGLATFNLGLKDTNIYLGQTVGSTLNQLVLKNFNFNFNAQGFMYVDDAKGLYLTTVNQNGDDVGYVNFKRVADSGNFTGSTELGTYEENGQPTNAGLNLEFMLKPDVSQTSAQTLYEVDDRNNPVGATGLIRVGASGRMQNAYLQLRGTDSTGSSDAQLFGANTNAIIGDRGIGFRMYGEFTNTDTANGDATTLEIGGAGLNTYGFEFSELSGLNVDPASSAYQPAYFDSGNVYINLAQTNAVSLPTNAKLLASQFGNGGKLTSSTDYTHDIADGTATPNTLLVATRGTEFQAIARKGRFTNSATFNPASGYVPINESARGANSWGLALPFHNLNTNMAIYGTEKDASQVYYYRTNANNQVVASAVGASGVNAQRLGLSLAMSTQGVSSDGGKTTSIMVIDGDNDYYMGIRNIDMLLKGTGSIGVEHGSLNAELKDLLIVMAGEIAAGYLPGAKNSANQTVADNVFATPADVLLGAKLRLGGNMGLSLVPNSQYKSDGTGGAMNIIGEFELAETGNTIQVSDPIDGSTIGLDNITGKLAFNNAIVIAPKTNVPTSDNTYGEGTVSFNTALTFNPNKGVNGVLRVKDLNLYGPNNGNAARLGEIAITGGRLSSQFSIMPRN